jgi:hypothetical protein
MHAYVLSSSYVRTCCVTEYIRVTTNAYKLESPIVDRPRTVLPHPASRSRNGAGWGHTRKRGPDRLPWTRNFMRPSCAGPTDTRKHTEGGQHWETSYIRIHTYIHTYIHGYRNAQIQRYRDIFTHRRIPTCWQGWIQTYIHPCISLSF